MEKNRDVRNRAVVDIRVKRGSPVWNISVSVEDLLRICNNFTSSINETNTLESSI